MNISVNSTNQSVRQTLIVGVPEHLNQFETLSVNGVDIRENIGFLKQNHLIGSSLGKVYQTHFQLQDEHYRLISVGLGNLKQLDYTQLLQVFGKLFQFLKSEHILSVSL
ncbi:M17 family peptidase N-terminal domain-containing protein, partial [Staphylococcus arlettae]